MARMASTIVDGTMASRSPRDIVTASNVSRPRDGRDRSAPASSFYHLMAAFTQLAETGLEDVPHLTLS